MKQRMKFPKLVIGLLLLASSACTKKAETPPAAAPAPAAPAPVATEAAAPAAPSAMAVDGNAKPDVQIELGSNGDENTFDKAELKVKAGAIVRLTFKNNAKGSGMEHNWVLLAKEGVEAEVATAGTAAGAEKGWTPAGPNVLAHSRLIKPNEADTILFRAPAAGKYPYICTFPGHYVTMKGVLVAE